MTRGDLGPRAGFAQRLHLLAGNALLGLRARLAPRVTFGVRLVAFDGEGRVLLVRHSYVPGWHLPGGAVDPGETARVAAIREAREEAALVLDAPPRLLGLYARRAAGVRDHVAVYVAEGVRSDPGAPKPGLEILETGFFRPEDLPEATTRGTRRRLAEALGAAEPSDEW